MRTILKPTGLKIVLAIVLLLVFSWLWRKYIMSTVSDTFPLGFPLQFFLAWGPCQAEESCSEFNGLWLLLDIAFWYVVGSLIMDRLVKRRNLL
jgi:uncharacterized membrane protein (DUF106 family)